MKDWLENYRPVRHRTMRSETTKGKAGTPPPAVYSNANPNATARVFCPADQVKSMSTRGPGRGDTCHLTDFSETWPD